MLPRKPDILTEPWGRAINLSVIGSLFSFLSTLKVNPGAINIITGKDLSKGSLIFDIISLMIT